MVAAQSRSDSTDTFTVKNPANGEVIKELPIFSPDAVRAEMETVRRASLAWRALPLAERCDRLRPVMSVIRRRRDEIARIVSDETGKVRQEAILLDVAPTLATMHYFIEHAERILEPEPMHLAVLKHRRSYISYEPKGVIGVITPWNFPFFMPGSDCLIALVGGSGVLLKPSEVTPLSALILKECYDEGGVDPNLFRVVTGLGPTGSAVIESMPDHVVFTGSVPTGRRIGIACAERFIPCTLELGGKAPALILEDADVERASNAIVWGGFVNCGQICAAVERVYADARIYDDLVDRVTRKTSALRVGPASDSGEIDVGPMTFARQREIVERLVADAKAKGARVTAGGERTGDPNGLFFQPTVLADCNHDMAVMKEEIFGPVVPIMKVSGEEEAIRLANDSHLGLGAYVFTGDRARGRRVAQRIEVGSVMINDVIMHSGVPDMPWGGIKQSGIGVARSDRALKSLCNARHINEELVPALKKDPVWYPYSSKTLENARKVIDLLFGDSTASKAIRFFIR